MYIVEESTSRQREAKTRTEDPNTPARPVLARGKKSTKDNEEMAVCELQLSPDNRRLPDPSAHPGIKGGQTVTLTQRKARADSKGLRLFRIHSLADVTCCGVLIAGGFTLRTCI